MHPETQRKHLLALRSYWKFMGRRGLVKVPSGETAKSGWPWNDQQVEKAGKRAERGAKEKKERPFTDVEVLTLLHKPLPKKQKWEAVIRDALPISLLSGMRLAEVLTLWVEVHDDFFDIQQGKTVAAARLVPIHPALKEIVSRRLKGKGPKHWLFS